MAARFQLGSFPLQPERVQGKYEGISGEQVRSNSGTESPMVTSSRPESAATVATSAGGDGASTFGRDGSSRAATEQQPAAWADENLPDALATGRPDAPAFEALFADPVPQGPEAVAPAFTWSGPPPESSPAVKHPKKLTDTKVVAAFSNPPSGGVS